ncbi:MAG: TraB/GumN family protein [Cyclobacteriaceae bacterium]
MKLMNAPSRNFQRLLIIVIGVFIALSIVHESKAQKLEQSLLWKIEGKGIQPSYVFGTFHLLSQKDFELKEKVKLAFQAADQIVLELDMDDPGMQMKVMQHASMKDGKTLDELLTDEEYKMIDRVLISTIGAGLRNYNTVKPVVLSSLLLPTLIDGLPASFELTLVQMAAEKNKEMFGLESVAEQMQVFDKIPYQDQIDDILEIVTERERMQSLFNSMVEVYKMEDVTKMYEMISEYMNGENELASFLLERNRNWISRIDKFARQKSSFFGVGAGHIGGNEGVINLLRKEGYTVTAIK